MKNFINSFLIILTFIFFLYGCSEEGPSIQTNNNSTNQVPNKPKNPFPADSSENIDTNVVMVLSWQCSDPDVTDTVKYDVYISNDLPVGGTPIVTNLLNPSYGLGIVAPSTNYYWKVVARDNHGASNTSNTWRFKTQIRQ
ncbi:MAG: hypothetical protein ABI543_01645 [Ignavibacteria bacterium]